MAAISWDPWLELAVSKACFSYTNPEILEQGHIWSRLVGDLNTVPRPAARRCTRGTPRFGRALPRSGLIGRIGQKGQTGGVRTPVRRSFVQTVLQPQNYRYSIQLAVLVIDGETMGSCRSATERILGHEGQVELYGGIVNDISMENCIKFRL